MRQAAANIPEQNVAVSLLGTELVGSHQAPCRRDQFPFAELLMESQNLQTK